jgi:hypothetical protein
LRACGRRLARGSVGWWTGGRAGSRRMMVAAAADAFCCYLVCRPASSRPPLSCLSTMPASSRTTTSGEPPGGRGRGLAGPWARHRALRQHCLLQQQLGTAAHIHSTACCCIWGMQPSPLHPPLPAGTWSASCVTTSASQARP